MRPRDRTRVTKTSHRGPERRTGQLPPERVQPVILTRKFADVINDIDLAGRSVGDRLPLSVRDARLLIAEGWAEDVPEPKRRKIG